MLKKLLQFILVFLSIVALTGCHGLIPIAQEINTFEVIQVVGIDKCAQNPSHIEVTFISQQAKGSSGADGEGKTVISILSEKGPTIFDAQRKIKAYADKTMFFGYVDYFLICDTIAKEDFGSCFDFVFRDHEIRLAPKVFLVKDITSKDLITKTNSEDKFIIDRLKSIESDIALLSKYNEVTILDVAAMLSGKTSVAVIPVLAVKNVEEEETSTSEIPKVDIETSGYGIIKDFKLKGYIEKSFARGYNFLVNNVYSSVVNVEDAQGKLLALEVINSKTKVKAKFKGDVLEKVTYKTYVNSNIGEQHGKTNIFTSEALEKIAQLQSEIIKSEMQKVIEVSQELESDTTNLGQKIEMRHPLKWVDIKDKWNEIYPNLEIEIVVESKILKSFDIDKPIGYDFGS